MVRLSWNDGMYCGEFTDIIQPLFAIGMKIPKSICPPSCCASAGCLACLWRDAEAVVLPPPEAERRRLTVLFCDLVGSTTLAGHTWTRKTCGRWCVPIIRPVPR